MKILQDIRYVHLFDTSSISKETGKKSAKAGAANIIAQGISLAIDLVRAAILARLLTPEDYGVFSMVVVVASFAVIFKDLGLSTATIREKEITHAQVSNLFWINTGIGLVSTIVVMATAPLTAWFYHDDRLVSIAVLLSVAFFFAGLSVQHQALLKRQMQFGKIAIIHLLSLVLSSIIGVLIAWKQENYWALVWMQVSQNFFQMIGFWLLTGWQPGFPSRRAKIKSMLKLGADVAGLNAFSTFSKQIDKIVAGKITDASSLGLYNKGFQVPNLIAEQFRLALFSVALPALSSMQAESERFASFYLKFLNIVCWATMPLSAFCFVFAEEIIFYYLGPRWSASVDFMRIFSLYSFLMPAMTTMDQIPLALGQSKRYLRAGMARCISLVISVLFIAPLYGIVGIALCLPIGNLVIFPIFQKICLLESPVSKKMFYSTISLPALISLSVGGLCMFGKASLSSDNTTTSFLLMGVFGIIMICCFLLVDIWGKHNSIGVLRFLFKHSNATQKI